uniref:Uncharacterized protein n=1 Tax=Anguilla anguilla TaxID=7936 RepID=A0A0E9X4D6_ANGAN
MCSPWHSAEIPLSFLWKISLHVQNWSKSSHFCLIYKRFLLPNTDVNWLLHRAVYKNLLLI